MSLNFIDCLFLIPIFAIGLICSYTDIKYGKILNKIIIVGILYAFFLYLALFFYNLFFVHQESNFYYLFDTVLNGIISFVVSYSMWHFKSWSAGDAKLFTVYAFLVPLKFYSKSYILYFPSFALLVNLFIPLFFVLMCNAFFTLVKEVYGSKQKLKELKGLDFKIVFKKLKSLGNWFISIFLNYIFIFILFQLLTNFLKNLPGTEIISNRLFHYFLLLLVMKRFTLIKEKKKRAHFFINGVSIIYCSFLFFSGNIQILKNMLKTALVFMVLISGTRQILNFYIKKKEVKKVKVRDFKEGMIIVPDEISSILKKLKTKEEKEDFSWIGAGGLNSNQVKIIKNLFNNNLESSIRTYKTFPFAPFMLLAAVILVITQSSFLITIDTLFNILLK